MGKIIGKGRYATETYPEKTPVAASSPSVLLQYGTAYTASGNLDPVGDWTPVPAAVSGNVVITFTDWTADDVLDGAVEFTIASSVADAINLVVRVEVSLNGGTTWNYIDGGSGPPVSCAFNVTAGGAGEIFSAGAVFSVALPSAPMVRLTYLSQGATTVTTLPTSNAIQCKRLGGAGLVQPLTSLLQAA